MALFILSQWVCCNVGVCDAVVCDVVLVIIIIIICKFISFVTSCSGEVDGYFDTFELISGQIAWPKVGA